MKLPDSFPMATIIIALATMTAGDPPKKKKSVPFTKVGLGKFPIPSAMLGHPGMLGIPPLNPLHPNRFLSALGGRNYFFNMPGAAGGLNPLHGHGFSLPGLGGLGLGSQGLGLGLGLASPFPGGPSLGGGPGFAPLDELYTAISKDPLDPLSQMRLTIRPKIFTGLPMDNGLFSWDEPLDWSVEGTFIGSQVKNKAGTYYLVLTKGGRTADGCSSTILGDIITHPIGHAIGNPFYQGNRPSGVMPNQLLLGSTGPTMYSSELRGVTRKQLLGAGLAACEYVYNGKCEGYIPFCASVSKDLLPAMELPLLGSQRQNVMPFDPFLPGGSGLLGLNTDSRFGNEDEQNDGLFL